MIRLEQPALALHSHDVPGYKYKMQFTEILPDAASVENVVAKILVAANNTPEQHLKNVVINCHGSWGTLYVGTGHTINTGNLGVMRLLQRTGPKVDTIWLVACLVAGFNDPQYHRRQLPVKLGAFFCAALAKAAGCYVVAAEKTQYVNPGFYLRLCPKYCIDDFEGPVYRWDRNGAEEVFKP
jgi:hypothetical protein